MGFMSSSPCVPSEVGWSWYLLPWCGWRRKRRAKNTGARNVSRYIPSNAVTTWSVGPFVPRVRGPTSHYTCLVVRCCTRECTDPSVTVILSRALALAQGTAAAASQQGRTSRWWPMGKARDKAGKRGAAGQQGNQGDKAKERSERARLRKDRQRNSVYSSSADDREFEAQVRD